MEEERRFYEALDEDYENEYFRPLEDDRESIREIREQFSEEDFPAQDVKMSYEQIKKVMENMVHE